jgi:hypothetical protein
MDLRKEEIPSGREMSQGLRLQKLAGCLYADEFVAQMVIGKILL